MAISLNRKELRLDLSLEMQENIVKDITASMNTPTYLMNPVTLFRHNKYSKYCFEIGSLDKLKKIQELGYEILDEAKIHNDFPGPLPRSIILPLKGKPHDLYLAIYELTTFKDDDKIEVLYSYI